MDLGCLDLGCIEKQISQSSGDSDINPNDSVPSTSKPPKEFRFAVLSPEIEKNSVLRTTSGGSQIMTTSRRLADRKVEKFDKNIVRRGSVPETSAKKGKSYPVGPVMLGFFVFVVIGSCKIVTPSTTCSVSDNQDSYKWGHGLTAAAVLTSSYSMGLAL
ncbi:Endoplasmic reticulum, stress-associated Ramp4 [Cynara cardunculus var. scolymus]|uniref:Endoplasmic reticulum, stress-associated Ramp4 n=1 Tax=Cynara cardunculus var. scolymus TaxID=59895 RepID=A0A118JXX0_CYNCS|nr:Endoplasmic reticulum, stress-associated Ramp4 [Cynara cardunculus var. scolymus]